MTAAIPAQPRQRQWSRPHTPFGDNVAQTVASLQAQFLADNPRAVAALARLRRGIGREPGFDYTLDAYLDVPDELLGYQPRDGGSAAVDTEYAKHAAVTLYALHQQSQRLPAHVPQRGLGQAIAELTRASTNAGGVRRRFAALGTAMTFDEAQHHLRGLVQMLRDHGIPLDYGLLADDLKTLRRSGGRTQMQAVWGREFYRSKPARTDDDVNPDTTQEAQQ